RLPGEIRRRCMAGRAGHQVRMPRLRPWRMLMLAVVLAYTGAFAIRIVARRYYIVVPDYVRWSFATSSEAAKADPTHVIFLFADHFEPSHDATGAGTRKWIARYRDLADRHHDHSGRPLQHTWFYPGERHSTVVLT